jgi:tetratricopeptide (TPR) repeat protein
MAACAAVASAALEVPIVSDVAATACVSARGALLPVTFLREKLDALARHQPGVTRLIVAKEQTLPEGQWSVRLVPCATLVEALEQFGLPWERLPPADVNSYRRALRGFALDDEDTTAVAEWERLAGTALTAYRVLSNAGAAYRAEAGEALGWWVLFSAHAGRSDDIDAFRDDYKALSDAVEPHVRALIEVFAASAQMDPDPASAVEASRAAVRAARDLDRGRDTVLGRAIGTHGRALLHAGDPASALPFLREAVDEHRRCDPGEVPRSLTYLATGNRLAGDPTTALAYCEEALGALQASPRQTWASKTRAYLLLERGRCLLELERFAEALNAFDEVTGSCEYDHEYPRSGALRGLAAAHWALGNHHTASEFHRRCLRVANDPHHGKTLRQVAAMAIADAVIATAATADELRTWRVLFGEELTDNTALRARRGWVY